ncbi:MAG: prepilin peptidase [Acidobacteria bacterium]|nr:prepilin peptidase [Acidobacteriota bacterium]
MTPELIVYALFGLIIGSFLNVCIYRIPLGKSIVFPGSGCPHCGKSIRFYDNIPIISYLLLLGRCRFCRERISVQYPMVELLTAVVFYACGKTWNFQSPTYVNTLFLAVIIILIFTDYHHQILPNVLTLPGIFAGILLSSFQTPLFYSDVLSVPAASTLWPQNPMALLPWIGSLIGAIIGGGSLYIVAWVYEKLRKREGLGMGDVKMMAMIGAFLGWPLAVLTVGVGSLLGTVVGIFLILFRNMSMQTKLALGVFLGIAAAFSLFYGLPILHWYGNIHR